MTAEEVYKSSDGNVVGKYYDQLAALGRSGELAAHLFRMHRNCDRIKQYDDPKYLRFLNERRKFAAAMLLNFLQLDGKYGTTIHVVLPPPECVCVALEKGDDIRVSLFSDQIVFEENGGWQTNEKNAKLIFQFCDQLMGTQRSTNEQLPEYRGNDLLAILEEMKVKDQQLPTDERLADYNLDYQEEADIRMTKALDPFRDVK